MDLSYGLFSPPSVEYLSSLRPYQPQKNKSYVFLYAIDPAQLSEAESAHKKWVDNKVFMSETKIKIVGRLNKEAEDATTSHGNYPPPSDRDNSLPSDDSYEDASDDSGQNMVEMTLSD